MGLLFYRAYTHTKNTIFVYILYKYNSSLWIHFKYMIYMISHLIPQYHRIAIFKCNKNIQNSAWNADFFVFYFDSKLYHKNIIFRVLVQTLFHQLKIQFQQSPAYVQARCNPFSNGFPVFVKFKGPLVTYSMFFTPHHIIKPTFLFDLQSHCGWKLGLFW